MNKIFVPYNIAQALKEAGFNEPCLGKWTSYNQGDPIKLFPHSQNFFDGPDFKTCSNEQYRKGGEKNKVAAPTYDQVIDWLINNHNIVIEVRSNVNREWSVFVNRYTEMVYTCPTATTHIDSRYQALNKGILGAIELIKKRK